MTEAPRKDAMLSYAPATLERRKWVFRAVLILCAFLVVGFSVWRLAPEFMKRCQMLYWQHRVAKDVANPATVVVSTRYQLVSDRLKFPSTFRSGPTSSEEFSKAETIELLGSDVFDDLLQFRSACLTPLPSYSHALYAHDIKDRHGNDLIIGVCLNCPGDDVQITAEVLNPGSIWRNPGPASIIVRRFAFKESEPDLIQGGFKVYVGQPDSTDASHFTIDYDLNGQRHTLDGYINDQDVLTIEKRKESTTQPLPSLPGQSQ